MGASTAVLHTLNNPNPKICCLILDSVFISLKRVFEEIGKEKINLP